MTFEHLINIIVSYAFSILINLKTANRNVDLFNLNRFNLFNLNLNCFKKLHHALQ